MIQVDELSFEGGKIFCAYSREGSFPANGGLRVMQYPSEKDAKIEAIGLASRMVQKHKNYRTGFRGGKIVAAVEALDSITITALIEKVGSYLNERKGDFLTGCDLNFGDREIAQLSKKSRHILAALNSDVHYAEATAAGVIGAVRACMESEGISSPRVIIHGCGAVGSRCAKRLASEMELSTYDFYP
jgi:leucine dehydrogenase